MNEFIKQKAQEILGKHCPDGLTIEGSVLAIVEGIEMDPKEPYDQEDREVHECLYFDEAQGRYLCTTNGTDFRKCIDVKCGFFEKK